MICVQSKGDWASSVHLRSLLCQSQPLKCKSTLKSKITYCQVSEDIVISHLYNFYTSSLEHLSLIPPLPLSMRAALSLLLFYLKFILSASLLCSFSNFQSNAKNSPTILAKQKISTKKNLKFSLSPRSVHQYSCSISELDEIQSIG